MNNVDIRHSRVHGKNGSECNKRRRYEDYRIFSTPTNNVQLRVSWILLLILIAEGHVQNEQLKTLNFADCRLEARIISCGGWKSWSWISCFKFFAWRNVFLFLIQRHDGNFFNGKFKQQFIDILFNIFNFPRKRNISDESS